MHACMHAAGRCRCACCLSPPPPHTLLLACLQALARGVLAVVATDHAVFNSSQKAAGAARRDFRAIPNGVNGIEERMHVTWQTMVLSGAVRHLAQPVQPCNVVWEEALLFC